MELKSTEKGRFAAFLKDLRTASPLTTLITMGVEQIFAKEEAEKTYRVVVPRIKKELKGGADYGNEDIQEGISLVLGLSPFGAKRRNFKRWYVGSKEKFMSLPDDPDKLSIACWW
ncbi:hypothetical protein MHM95_00670 [Pseudoalteromonas sp. CnMc7-15]|uniref:hypothetical protein n=1 Tax=unclassified Pseudoalteromonas TaxID=194690 RepID=UPI001EF4EA0F|nr:hypothetical protein [Pseudoalteromonas sp. CnMc7-15]MCG7564806.1 hypothetical protein [Pseudoalteromonas sp. CnMc7-15]